MISKLVGEISAYSLILFPARIRYLAGVMWHLIGTTKNSAWQHLASSGDQQLFARCGNQQGSNSGAGQ